MKAKQIAVLLSGAALFATVLGASAANIGDETDTSWQYAPTARPFFSDSKPSTAKQVVRIGDENDASWEYTPKAKPFFSGTDHAGRAPVETGDEHDTAQFMGRKSKTL